MGWRALIACVFVGGLMACTAKTRNADPGLTATALAPPSPVRIELPFSAEGWRATLETDARELEQLLDRVLAHWPRKEGAGELRLLVLPNPVHAQLWAKQAGLPGDARVPRTHPRARLAVVPMAREDRLMTFRAVPPRTLRETIRHEMAHLFMLDRPGLAEAPLWFHEGLAEAWVGLREIESVSASSHALGACWQSELESEIAKARLQSVEAVDAHTAIADLPAELRYTAWAELVLRLLREHKGERPWELAEARPSLASFLASAPKEAEDPRVSLPGLPRPLGREIDFVAGRGRRRDGRAGGAQLARHRPVASAGARRADWRTLGRDPAWCPGCRALRARAHRWLWRHRRGSGVARESAAAGALRSIADRQPATLARGRAAAVAARATGHAERSG